MRLRRAFWHVLGCIVAIFAGIANLSWEEWRSIDKFFMEKTR